MRALGTAALWTTIAAASAAWAQGDTTVNAAGRDLALEWCSECHLVARDQTDPASDAVPSFFEVADRSSTTEMSLRAFLTSPHGNMPNIMLTREQIDEVVAYILSLRGQ
jgi:mono/diheme cytochrome c family protein